MINKINIPVVETYEKIKDILINFFMNIDQTESIVVGVISLGVILLVIGLILL